MAGEDYSVKTKVEADVSNFEKGMNKAEKSLKSFSSKLADNINRLGKKGLVGSMANVGLALNGVTSAFNIASKAVKKISQAIDECTEAYRKQYKAEKSLDVAIKNSSLVDGSATRGLKQFASEIQSISEIGDEELLPMMSQLIATGRTEAEVMNVIRVATDMSATGTISFDTAVQQLNATLNGNIGRLGQQNAELNNLTEEELKSGKAVEILGQKYNGLAQATADSSKQLKNALGDFKELVGQSFEQALKPMRKYFTELITKTNDAIKKAREHKKAVADVFTDDGGVKTTGSTESMQTSLIELQKEYERAYRDQQQYLKLYGQYIDQTTDATAQAYERDIKALQDKINLITEELLKRKQANEFATSEAEREKARAENEKKIADLKQKYLEKIAEQEEKWKNIETVTKEQVSNEEKLKFYQENLVSIMTEAGGQISTNNQYYKDQMAIINDLINKIAENPAPSSEWASKLLDQRIEMLETERDIAMQNAEAEGEESYTIWRDYNEKILELKLERLEAEKEKSIKEEHLTAEDKIAIEEYYEGETEKIYDELGDYKKKKGKEEEKDTEFMYNAIIQMAKKYAGSIKNIFSKIANTIKDVFSKIGNFVKNVFDKTKNAFSKLFSFNVDDALTALLKVEDAILTFFVETLPRLPSFFESAFSSVLKTIKSLIDYIDWGKVAGFLTSIIQTFVNYAPEIVSGIVEIFTNLVTTISNVLVENAPQIVSAFGEMFFTIIEALPSLIENFMNVMGTFLSELGRYITENGDRLAQDLSNIVSSIVKGISNFITNGGWRNILNALLTIQRALEKAVMDNIDELVDTIIAGLPDLINMLIESIVSASKTLAKLIKPILKLIIALIKALIEVAFSDEVLDASIEVVQALIEAILDLFINELPRSLPKIITKITGFITKSLPKMTNAIVKTIVKLLVNTNWGEVLHEAIVGFAESFGEVGEMLKDIFEDAFNTIGELLNTLWQGTFANPWLWHVLNGMADNVKQAFAGIGDFFNGVWNNLTSGASWAGEQLKNGFEWAINGIKGFFEGLASKVSEIFNKIGDGIKWAINGIIWTVNQVIAGINSVVGWTGIKINQIGYLAKGTNNAQKGMYLVGEAGPELVQFNGGERVLNNRNTNKALSEMGSNGGNTFNVIFNNLQDTTAFAMMNQLKQYKRQMAINSII